MPINSFQVLINCVFKGTLYTFTRYTCTSAMEDTTKNITAQCMDGVAVDIPVNACVHMGFLKDLLDVGDVDAGVDLFDVQSEHLNTVLHFVAQHMQEPILMEELYGFPEGYAEDEDDEDAAAVYSGAGNASSDASVEAASDSSAKDGAAVTPKPSKIPKALPNSLNLKAWGLPQWTVDWLHARSTPELFDMLRVASALDCDVLSTAVCAKLAAVYRSCDPGDIDAYVVSLGVTQVPTHVCAGYEYSVQSFHGHDRKLYATNAEPVHHPIQPREGEMYTVNDFLQELTQDTFEGMFRCITQMT